MWTRRAIVALAIGLGASAVVAPVPSGAGPRQLPPTPGYWLVGDDGGVFAFNAPFYGACGFFPPAPSGCVGIAAVPNGSGYWLLNTAAGPLPFGQAGPSPLAGSCTVFNDPGNLAPGFWTSVASTNTGAGYWVVTGPGNVYGCGDANPPTGGTTSVTIWTHSVGIAATPDGKGYWVASADGGVYAFGDAAFAGSMGGRALDSPIVGVATTPDGMGTAGCSPSVMPHSSVPWVARA
jgi:hypothetical protein